MYRITYLRCKKDGTFDMFTGVHKFESSGCALESARIFNREVDATYPAMRVVSEDGRVIYDNLTELQYLIDPMGGVHVKLHTSIYH